MAQIINVTEDNWQSEVIESDTPVVVNFWGPACSWCKRLDPIYDEVAEGYEGRLKFTKLNVAVAGRIAAGMGIMGTPTLKFFCNGRPVSEIVGFRPRDQLKAEIERVLSSAQECIEQSTELA